VSESGRFDQAAPTWDQEDRRVALARAVVEAIRRHVPLSPADSVLDFGCGTGLVTLGLAPHVGAVAGADSSRGMLEALAAKAPAMTLVSLDPGGASDLGGPYSLIVSSMTLHHIPDVPALLAQFVRHLRPGGRVALADLDAEDGSFHGDATDVHHLGFTRERMASWLRVAGFSDVRVEDAASMVKAGRDYTVFLALGGKD